MICDNGPKMDDVLLRPYDSHDQVGFKKLVIDSHEEYNAHPILLNPIRPLLVY